MVQLSNRHFILRKKLNDLLVSVSGSKPFVKTLRSIARLHTLVSARHLDPKYEDIIWDFAMDWHNLYKELQIEDRYN